VAATSGQIVTYRGSPAVTYFFSSSGGYTENIENVWPGATPQPWLRGVPDPYDSAGGSNPYYRWTYTLSLSAAQRRLGSLVRGSLVGIRVLSHGVSPRIVSALVVGTRGSTQVTGSQLEGALQLPSTYATFTTISTYAGLAPRTARDRRTHGRLARLHLPAGWGFAAMLEAVVAPVHALHGTVFPGRSGDAIVIQQAVGHSWRAVGHARLGRGGSFSVRVAKSGRYRIVDGSLNGPAVTVS
jgi:stage II sporulation protein D